MIRNSGYVKAGRIKLFGLLLTGSFISCFHTLKSGIIIQLLGHFDTEPDAAAVVTEVLL